MRLLLLLVGCTAKAPDGLLLDTTHEGESAHTGSPDSGRDSGRETAPDTAHTGSPETGHDTAPDTAHTGSPETGHETAPDTAHTGSPETGHETAPDTSHTGSPETGHETAPDTSHTGSPDSATDTAAPPPSPWSPGDAIPGWDDADCTETNPYDAYTIQFPDIFLIEGEFVGASKAAGPQEFTIQLRDCAFFPCEDTLDLTKPYVSAVLTGAGGDDGYSRGQGAWGSGETDPRELLASGRTVLSDFPDGGYDPEDFTVSVCIERSRPDEVRGVVRAQATSCACGGTSTGAFILRLPFTVRMDDHAGFDVAAADRVEDRPSGFGTAHFLYDVPYDDAWPWDDISDPDVRTQVYERYLPYNDP